MSENEIKSENELDNNLEESIKKQLEFLNNKFNTFEILIEDIHLRNININKPKNNINTTDNLTNEPLNQTKTYTKTNEEIILDYPTICHEKY